MEGAPAWPAEGVPGKIPAWHPLQATLRERRLCWAPGGRFPQGKASHTQHNEGFSDNLFLQQAIADAESLVQRLRAAAEDAEEKVSLARLKLREQMQEGQSCVVKCWTCCWERRVYRKVLPSTPTP